MVTAVEEKNMKSAVIVPTRKSERQLRRLNESHGRLTMTFLQRELAAYILCHERAGRSPDPEGQVLRFDERLCLLIRRLDGVWHILRIWRREAGEICQPVYVWREIRRGWAMVVARVLAGWRYERMMPMIA